MNATLTNHAAVRQQAWTFCGLKQPIGAVGTTTEGWPWFECPGGVMILAEMDAMTTVRTPLIPDAGVQIPDLDPQVINNAAKLIPRFLGWTRDRQPRWAYDLAILSTSLFGRGFKVSWRTRCPEPVDLTIEGHHFIWPDAKVDAVDISWLSVWGTTATQGMSQDLSEVSMVTAGYPVIRHRIQKGLPEPVYLPHFQAWKQDIVAPVKDQGWRTMGRASRIKGRGRLYPARTFANFAEAPDRPITAVADDWDGAWLALGETPQAPPNAALVSQQRYDEWTARTMTGAPPGDEYNERPKGTWKNAGQTGPADDFGCTEGEEAVVQLKPWAIYDYDYQVDEWALRPTSNRERSGAPIQAVSHPNTKTYNQRPDERFSFGDMLGWTIPVPYGYEQQGSGHTTQDDQHRADALLCAQRKLDFDPVTDAIIDDLIELDALRFRYPVGAPIGAPRDWGRTLLAWSNYLACGKAKARPLIDASLNALWAGASYKRIPQDAAHTVRVLSDGGGKYGWVDSNGNAIRAWVCWEECIAAIGLWAAWLQTGDERAQQMAITISETVVRHAFSKASGQWRAAYSVRWRTDDPGMPVPDEAFPVDGPTADHFGYPMQQWMLGSVRLAEAHSQDAAVRARATELLATFPIVNWDDASWRAMKL